ncbi:urea ABC transporter permease subunit UrtB [Cupriavidus taiwanensis]|uniref:Putative Branched-chain amino acid ABC TRANSPORTER, membrane component n=1 Tax=Cupriavidus taiwanensis TaxID=164546 RepID=A0A7Z7J9Z1_9BURK|nr:urea ABC transporter permease subunit UrtB [Cupriavidus taiwanensis]SOY86023.1 putative Branched-chain amino acid ABC TRANSPORTER, membrane component [Cupriavidus taiwanensis]SOZ01989.1 putative Branched-chain amino acid ABC TRANSPORTER, membrane component [Cupriavidus taiwanensis]SOZ04977.1 putative Branched-chain amino acid ABC TRANSPORTER, membrane component [Cupriavidus taiwanensis]SPC09459.1 putative Branched-chain amino acid ABC TRANSPORTER, membrane component [Cupriavidus taiwanensis]
MRNPLSVRVVPWLRALLAALLLASAPWAAALTQADLKPLAGDDFDAKTAALSALAKAAPAAAGPILKALQDDALQYAPSAGMVRQDGDKIVDAITGQPVTVKADELESLTLNNSLRALVDSAASSLLLQSPDIAVRAQAVATLRDQPESASLPAVEAARKNEADAGLRASLDVIWANLVLAGTPEPAAREARLEAIGILGRDSNPQNRQKLAPLVERDSAGRYREPDSSVRLAAQQALDTLQSGQRRAEVIGNLFAGLSLGSVLLLAALGLAITYGLIGVINMAHGEFLMIGAYATYVVQSLFRAHAPGAFDWYLPAALPASFLAAAMVGFVLERLVLRHLYGRPLETLLATFGISLLLMQAVRTLFGAQNVEVANPAWMSGGFEWLPGLVIPYNRVVIILFALAVVAVAWAVLNRTRLGLFVRATTQNRTMAACVGVRTWQVDSYAFAFGAGIAGLGGCALSQIGNVGPDLGQAYIIDSFMVVVLGGVGQLAGTIVGAFGLGILNKFIEPFYGAVLAKILVLVLIVLFIQKRPQGLFALKGRSAEA